MSYDVMLIADGFLQTQHLIAIREYFVKERNIGHLIDKIFHCRLRYHDLGSNTTTDDVARHSLGEIKHLDSKY